MTKFASTLNVKVMSAIDNEAVRRQELIRNIAYSDIPTLDNMQVILRRRKEVCCALDSSNNSGYNAINLNNQLDYLNDIIMINLLIK